jgi:hypothetical protein
MCSKARSGKYSLVEFPERVIFKGTKLTAMKQLPFFALVLLFLSCNDSADDSTTKKDSSETSPKIAMQSQTAKTFPPPTVDIEKFRLPDKDADKMMKFAKGCLIGCKNHTTIKDSNDPVYDAIVLAYPPPATIVPVEARYKDDDDEFRYTGARGLIDPAKCKVKKYLTKILKVSYKLPLNGKLVDATAYYDIYTICPPPEGDQPGLCKPDPILTDSTGTDSTHRKH